MTVHEAMGSSNQSLTARAAFESFLPGQPSEKGGMPLFMKHGFLKLQDLSGHASWTV